MRNIDRRKDFEASRRPGGFWKHDLAAGNDSKADIPGKSAHRIEVGKAERRWTVAMPHVHGAAEVGGGLVKGRWMESSVLLKARCHKRSRVEVGSVFVDPQTGLVSWEAMIQSNLETGCLTADCVEVEVGLQWMRW